MLNYTTTTFVNDVSTIHFDTNKHYFRVDFGPEFKNDDNHTPCLIAKTPYTAAVLAKAVIRASDISSLTSDDIYRIAMYIRLRNNNNPYYSNEWTFKGKPLFVEFKATGTGANDVDTIINTTKKYMLAQYGYELVKLRKLTSTEATALTTSSTTYTSDDLVIEATDQWQMFMDQDNNNGVILQHLVVADSAGNTGSSIVSGLPTHEEFRNITVSALVVDNGNEAFGDFAHVVKDLRLPTAANTRWQGIAQGDVFGGEPNDDRPLPTGHYTQYTIQYDAERGIGQQTVLGGIGTSRTVHVFYVESAAVSAFENALTRSTVVNDRDNDHAVDSNEIETPNVV